MTGTLLGLSFSHLKMGVINSPDGAIFKEER